MKYGNGSIYVYIHMYIHKEIIVLLKLEKKLLKLYLLKNIYLFNQIDYLK